MTCGDNSGAETGYRVLRRPAKNYALTLPSVASNARIPNSSAYNFGTTGAFTVEFWVRPASATEDRKLLVRDAGGLPNGSFLIGFIGNRLYPEVFDAGGDQTFSAGNVPNGQWSHIAVTYQTNGALIGYVNGVEVGRKTGTGASFAASTQPIRLAVSARAWAATWTNCASGTPPARRRRSRPA